MSLFSFSHFLVSFFLFKKFSGLCLFLFSAVSYSLCLDPSFLKKCIHVKGHIVYVHKKRGNVGSTQDRVYLYLLSCCYFYCTWGESLSSLLLSFFWDAISFFLCQKEHFFCISLLCTVQLIIFTSTQPLLKKDKTSIK